MSKVELLQKADVISLHCPLLPSTYHIIDKARCFRMRSHVAYLHGGRVSVMEALQWLMSLLAQPAAATHVPP